VFIWTPPHFWALAIHRHEEYKKAEVPMLPVTHGLQFTRVQILLYTVLLFIVTLLPYLTGMSGIIYLVSAVMLGVLFLGYAIKIYREPENPKIAFKTFMYSVNYLMVLFISLLVDHYLLITFGTIY
jgi:protoheme IX farnesyltransferase